jgi:UDP-N-acetylglucosamine--N-acetylmuramyl-(pentapeptide) pyrophosphoryl-undecaprenol N-acetylglucosamine transferase
MTPKKQIKNIFLIAGRTGGPFFPLPTIANNLSDYEPIYIGVKGGFEQQAIAKLNSKLEFLPDIRLTILSFKKEKLSETIANYFKVFLVVLKFIWALFKSFFLVIKYNPKMIYSTGSFLSIPIFIAAKIANFTRITKIKLVVHQQDPEPGLANKICSKWAHYNSCVFEYTKENFSDFKTATVIPNPVESSKYNQITDFYNNILKQNNPKLLDFVNQKNSKPLLFIFGGGSGSEDFNVWLTKNFEQAIKKFRIIHLTGLLQKTEVKLSHPDYFGSVALFTEMIAVMKLCDVVLCRAGLGSITELMLLQKPAFIVPLPSTHQELNAKLVSQYFQVLDQKDRPIWLQQIQDSYPKFFEKISYPSNKLTEKKLQSYYNELNYLLDN